MTRLRYSWTAKLGVIVLFCVMGTIASAAQNFRSLVIFNQTNGEDPFSSMLLGSDGNLYGTTVYGGTQNDGTMFKLTPSGTETVLYDFCSQSGCTDGSFPEWLTQASDGDFYGETHGGGAVGDGTISRSAPAGN